MFDAIAAITFALAGDSTVVTPPPPPPPVVGHPFPGRVFPGLRGIGFGSIYRTLPYVTEVQESSLVPVRLVSSGVVEYVEPSVVLADPTVYVPVNVGYDGFGGYPGELGSWVSGYGVPLSGLPLGLGWHGLHFHR